MTQHATVLASIPFPFCADAPLNFRFNLKLFSALRQSLGVRAFGADGVRVSRAEFIQHVILNMPEVSARLGEDDLGYVHLEMGAMRLATEDAIAREDFDTVYRHFSVVGAWFGYADDVLLDAILVSYLEMIFMGHDGPEYRIARGLLPANLEEALQKIEHYFERIEWQRGRHLHSVYVSLGDN